MLYILSITRSSLFFKKGRTIQYMCRCFKSDILQNNVDKKYLKKSLLEHILHRPDSYVGCLSRGIRNTWVYDQSQNKIIRKDVCFSPGLYKIFDEILVNAVDNKLRDSDTSFIKINIDKEKNTISIANDGPGIPVVMHTQERLFVPTMIFGHLLTSSNYDDSVTKFTGGRNGFGAKLCNLFSTEFTVETSNTESGYSFKQTWNNNMLIATEPIIAQSQSADFTKVTFSPDLSRFDMKILDSDIISLFQRRAFDVAACTKNLSVYFNDCLIPVHSFKDYVELHDSVEPDEIVYQSFNDQWEVAVTTSKNDTFMQTSFVNGINTGIGGQHVNMVTDQLTLKLCELAKKKMHDSSNLIKQHLLKNCLWVFINCYIANPTFESQSKETLTLLPKQFDSSCDIDDKFVTRVANCGVFGKLEASLAIKNREELYKLSGKKTSSVADIEKLDDAGYAGTSRSKLCTLILTEGDSAKTLVLSGLSVVGRDLYGVYPLKGKLVNVRDQDSRKVSENVELRNLVRIIGLKYYTKYDTIESLNSLRYGKIMIMTDQDFDGLHIKGLIINYLHCYWPEILKHNIVEQFVTPLIKAFKGDLVEIFFSENEYKIWQKNTPNHSKWRIKYYKGLGTSTSVEAKEYFANFDKHRIPFLSSEFDTEKLKLAFDKNKSNDRKLWLLKWMGEQNVNKESLEENINGKELAGITFADFVDKELIKFSNEDNERSIPSLMDGLKIGQRKIIYTCLKRNLKNEMKVAQLAGSVADMSSYHHGEMVLYDSIVGLAQNFVGSNNINLLEPLGQFGTRVYGGKDNASARYIFTRLSPLTRAIFHPMDDQILSYRTDYNMSIEPEWYAPIIPMILINGCEGIGTGWRSIMPNFNPVDVINNLMRLIDDKEPITMVPWYRNFTGTIQKISPTHYSTCGRIVFTGRMTFSISELPLSSWTDKYRIEVLNKLSEGKNPFVIKYQDHSTDTAVNFIVDMNPSLMRQAKSIGLYKLFKLSSFVNTTEMILFDEAGKIRKFECVEEILIAFYRARLPIYDKRKSYVERQLSANYRKIDNQSRFIKENIEGKIVPGSVNEKSLHEILEHNNYESDPLKEWKKSILKIDKKIEKIDEDREYVDGNDGDENGLDFNYLTSLPLKSLTLDNVSRLEDTKSDIFQQLESIQNKTSKQLWLDDLRDLEEKIQKYYR